MPNQTELMSIIDHSTDYPALEDGHPFIALNQHYWSSTTAPGVTKNAFSLDLNTAELLTNEKSQLLHMAPVRSLFPVSSRPRKETKRGGELAVQQEFVMKTAAEFRNEVQWPPSPRFLDNGDGTILDVVTGIVWLADANCFGKLEWKETFRALIKFNNKPQEFTCEKYKESYSDWQMPSLEELADLINEKSENSAQWMNSQGAVNVQSGGDYWTSNETTFNLYFANVINLKHGGARNYPKNLKFFIWPHRKIPEDESREPLLNLTINALGGPLTISPDEPISAAVYLHNFALRYPSEFWVWYVTPKGSTLWLSPIRLWREEAIPVFKGDLFNLKNYEIFRSNENNLGPGKYSFHFAVDFEQNEILDEPRYEVQVIVNVENEGAPEEGE